jgi:hypothetical protein
MEPPKKRGAYLAYVCMGADTPLYGRGWGKVTSLPLCTRHPPSPPISPSTWAGKRRSRGPALPVTRSASQPAEVAPLLNGLDVDNILWLPYNHIQ